MTFSCQIAGYFNRLLALNKTDLLNGVVSASLEDENTINTSTKQKRWRTESTAIPADNPSLEWVEL